MGRKGAGQECADPSRGSAKGGSILSLLMTHRPRSSLVNTCAGPNPAAACHTSRVPPSAPSAHRAPNAQPAGAAASPGPWDGDQAWRRRCRDRFDSVTAPCTMRLPSGGFGLLPGPLAGEAVVQADARFPPEVGAELGGVREGVALVAGPGRLLPDDRPAARQGFQFVDDVPDGGGLTPADVVDLPGVRRDGGDGGRHAVGDVGVAAHLLAVAVDGDRLLAEHRPDEEVVAHVRALAGSVDGEIA